MKENGNTQRRPREVGDPDEWIDQSRSIKHHQPDGGGTPVTFPSIFTYMDVNPKIEVYNIYPKMDGL